MKRLRSSERSGVTAAALASLLLAAPVDAQSYETDNGQSANAATPAASTGGRPCPQGGYGRNCGPRDRGGDGTAVAVAGGLAALVALGTIFGGRRGSRGDRLPGEDELKRDGPQLPTAYPVGSFSVRGFGRDGWPVVLDFRPAPRTRTTLDVIFGKRQAIPLVVDTNGLEGRHLVRLDIPRYGWAKKAKPANYILRSEYLDGSGPAPVQVYGIGGGPRAVGSVAVERLSFSPGLLRTGSFAQYDYVAKSPFQRTRAEVLKFQNDGDSIRLTRVMEASAEDVRVGRHGGRWDGTDQRSRSLSTGAHRFQVRAWFTSDDKSWVGAIAPELVSVR